MNIYNDGKHCICSIKWKIIRPSKIVQNVQNEHALFEIKSVNISWVFNFASFEIFMCYYFTLFCIFEKLIYIVNYVTYALNTQLEYQAVQRNYGELWMLV